MMNLDTILATDTTDTTDTTEAVKGVAVKATRKNSINVPVTMVAGVATVAPGVLEAALAAFMAKPQNVSGLAETETFLDKHVPVGSHMTRFDIQMAIATYTSDKVEQKSITDTVNVMLKDPSRFTGKKGRSAVKDGAVGGGYTRNS